MRGSQRELGVRRALLPQQRTGPDPHASEQRFERRAIRGRLQILDDVGSTPALRMSASALRDVPQAGL